MRLLSTWTSLGVSVIAMQSMAHEVTLKVDNITNPDGHLMVAVYDQPEHYNSNSRWVAVHKIKMAEGSMQLRLGDLSAGEYAIKVFQDENDNGRIDMNVLGIPTEPYGFSNNGGAFGQPSFDEAKVRVDDATEIRIKLR